MSSGTSPTADLAELQSDYAESEAVREQLADLLSRTAIALRGPEPELTRWSWHDVPERAAAAIAALGGATQAAAEAMRERDDLRAQRDELLAALRALMQMNVRGHTLEHRLQFSDAGRELLGMARAAIARAEGGAA